VKEFVDSIGECIEVTDEMIFYKIALPMTEHLTEQQKKGWTPAKKELQKELRSKKQHSDYELYNYIEYDLSPDELKKDLKEFAKLLPSVSNVAEEDIYIKLLVTITSPKYQKMHDAVGQLENELDQIKESHVVNAGYYTSDAKTRLHDMEKRWSNAKLEITQRLKNDEKLLKGFRLLFKKPSASSEEIMEVLLRKELIPFFYKSSVQFYLESKIPQRLLKVLGQLEKMHGLEITYKFSLTTNTNAGMYGCYVIFQPKKIAEMIS
jgi:hypothetical protein